MIITSVWLSLIECETRVIPSLIPTGHMAVFIPMHKYNHFPAIVGLSRLFLFWIYVLFNTSWLSRCFLLAPEGHQPSGDAESVRLLSLNILFSDFIEG